MCPLKKAPNQVTAPLVGVYVPLLESFTCLLKKHRLCSQKWAFMSPEAQIILCRIIRNRKMNIFLSKDTPQT